MSLYGVLVLAQAFSIAYSVVIFGFLQGIGKYFAVGYSGDGIIPL